MFISSFLPTPTQAIWDRDEERKKLNAQENSENGRISDSRALVSAQRTAPPYGKRRGWIPRMVDDFGDGGAFPEIHVAQYPMLMGKPDAETSNKGSNALAVQLDGTGKVKYDVIARQGHGKDKIVYSKFTDLLPKEITDEEGAELQRPDEEEVAEATEKTRAALEKLTSSKISAAMPVRAAEKTAPAQFIRYTPSQQGESFNSGAKQRVIRMVEVQKDPMSPPRFKINKKIPRGPPSPPAPVMHSPTRKVTVKEQQDWKIPPSISNWKNQRGYTIPLDKRLAADGRGLQQVHINENFSKLAESLYLADRKARESVEARAQLEKKMAAKEKEANEMKLRDLAQKAREERAGIRPQKDRVGGREDAGERERDELRKDRHRYFEIIASQSSFLTIYFNDNPIDINSVCFTAVLIIFVNLCITESVSVKGIWKEPRQEQGLNLKEIGKETLVNKLLLVYLLKRQQPKGQTDFLIHGFSTKVGDSIQAMMTMNHIMCIQSPGEIMHQFHKTYIDREKI